MNGPFSTSRPCSQSSFLSRDTHATVIEGSGQSDGEPETSGSAHDPEMKAIDSNLKRHSVSSSITYLSCATVVDSNNRCNVVDEPELERKPAALKPQFNEPAPTPQKITPYVAFRTWLTPYRQLFVVAFGLNVIGIGIELADQWSWAHRHSSLLVILNMLIAIAIRSEWILRLVYWISVKLFRHSFIPRAIRAKIVGILYHIGGLHSGCGLSALAWLITAVYRHFQEPARYHALILITLITCLMCIMLTCSTALPLFRGSHHNLFEMIHRFVGWTGMISTFIFVIVSAAWDSDRRRWDFRSDGIISQGGLWCMIGILIIIIGQWITVRNEPVTVFSASNKASVIRFPGGLTSGLHTRISRGGLREWHIFGSISEGKHADCHYVVMAVQGEFTENINREQPERIYTKRWKVCGLPYFSRMFRRGVAICTGSGIGAVGSTCIQHEDWFLIWIGPELNRTYGPEIMELVTSRIPIERRLIWDTKGPLGRPDVIKLLNETFVKWEAEVALFIGSPALNKNVLQAARVLNLPVFGSIWDA